MLGAVLAETRTSSNQMVTNAQICPGLPSRLNRVRRGGAEETESDEKDYIFSLQTPDDEKSRLLRVEHGAHIWFLVYRRRRLMPVLKYQWRQQHAPLRDDFPASG